MRLSHLLSCLVVALLLGACSSTGPGGRGFWKHNRTDRNGLAKGRWRTYYDDSKNEPFTTGKYRHGRPVGTFNYYEATGKLDHSEVYEREGFCEVTYWHPSGKVARKGKAQWVTGAKGARFYWYGPWTSYAEDGQITAVQTYTDGTITRAETYSNGQLTLAEEYKDGKPSRTETYQDGQLIKVETFERGRRTGKTNTI